MHGMEKTYQTLNIMVLSCLQVKMHFKAENHLKQLYLEACMAPFELHILFSSPSLFLLESFQHSSGAIGTPAGETM